MVVAAVLRAFTIPDRLRIDRFHLHGFTRRNPRRSRLRSARQPQPYVAVHRPAQPDLSLRSLSHPAGPSNSPMRSTVSYGTPICTGNCSVLLDQFDKDDVIRTTTMGAPTQTATLCLNPDLSPFVASPATSSSSRFITATPIPNRKQNKRSGRTVGRGRTVNAAPAELQGGRAIVAMRPRPPRRRQASGIGQGPVVLECLDATEVAVDFRQPRLPDHAQQRSARF